MINVVDTETTGFDPKDGGIVEIACVNVGSHPQFTEDSFLCSLVNPGFPTGFEAMGTHHITEAMIRDAPTLDAVILNYGLGVHDIWAAHNAEFDRSFFPAIIQEKKWICTWRCAMHLWPDAPSHKNQALRYWLGLDVSDMPEAAGKNAHRALYDAWVTAKLLERQIVAVVAALTFAGTDATVIIQDDPSITDKAIAELLRLSTAPLVLKTVRFGKHRDALWSDVPLDYKRWCLRQDFDKDVIHTCRHYLKLLP